MQLPDLSILLVMVVFWATYLVLRTFLFTPLGGILAAREAASSSAYEALERAVAREEEALRAIDQKLTGARRVALAEREAVRGAANEKRQAIMDQARNSARASAEEFQARLDHEIAEAREELRRGVASVASDIAETALGRKVA
jgi:F-type H+-transporting ATPase subunit b